jgi:microcystin-dependent protein
MAEPFLAEIRIFSFNFAPNGWALCNGQTLSINSNQALFALLGTTYGGNGTTTFQLPNLQGRVGMHIGTGFPLGQTGGEEAHTLMVSEMPAHSHSANADDGSGHATAFSPSGAYLANTAPNPIYSAGSSNMVSMSPAMLTTAGSGQAHENRQPFLTLNFCIALAGIFPSQN